MRLLVDFNTMEEDRRLPALVTRAQAKNLRVGATVELTDNEGTECDALVDEIPDARYIMAKPIEDSWRREPWTPPTVDITPPAKTGRRDLNRTAYGIVEQATGEDEPSDKNLAAAELGRKGGLKGGPARAAKLSPRQRKSIARKAAQARWSRNQGE